MAILSLDNMKRRVRRNVPGMTDPTLEDIVQEAYDKLTRMYPWTELETEFKLRTEQYMSTGGAHFTNASKDITASTTVSAAWASTTALSFTAWGTMFCRKDGEAAYYSIASATSVAICLSTTYGGKTTTAAASSGDGYRVFKHIYTIDTAVESVWYLIYNDDFMKELSPEEMVRLDPELEESGEPYAWRHAGVDTAGATRVQLYYPLVDDIYELRGKGKKRIETLTSSTKPLINSDLIIAFATADALQIQKFHNKAITNDDVQMARDFARDLLNEEIRANLVRRASVSKHVKDRLFGEGWIRGHSWFVNHDPFFV